MSSSNLPPEAADLDDREPPPSKGASEAPYHPIMKYRAHEAFRKGAEHGLVTLAGLTGISMAANKYWSFYRGFTFPAKVFFVGCGVVGVVMSSAHEQLHKAYYERNNIMPAGKMVPATWKDWLVVNKYYIVGKSKHCSV